MIRALALSLCVCALPACSAQKAEPDAAELSNMWRAYAVPKSSPARLVAAFDTYCASAGASSDAALRSAGYVPLPPEKGVGKARAYVVDDSRPAVVVSPTMCLVQAQSRTGQTDRFRAYVSQTYADARPIAPSAFGSDIEEAWEVSDAQALIATQRQQEFGWFTYALIYYQPGGR